MWLYFLCVHTIAIEIHQGGKKIGSHLALIRISCIEPDFQNKYTSSCWAVIENKHVSSLSEHQDALLKVVHFFSICISEHKFATNPQINYEI